MGTAKGVSSEAFQENRFKKRRFKIGGAVTQRDLAPQGAFFETSFLKRPFLKRFFLKRLLLTA
jgi:hypothetical protein